MEAHNKPSAPVNASERGGESRDPHPRLPGGSGNSSRAHCQGGLGEAKQLGSKREKTQA